MVLGGQDAWRRHPLISGCWKKPFPGLGTAVGIFSVYLFMDFLHGLSAPKSKPQPANISYYADPEGFDKPPLARIKGGSHSHH